MLVSVFTSSVLCRCRVSLVPVLGCVHATHHARAQRARGGTKAPRLLARWRVHGWVLGACPRSTMVRRGDGLKVGAWQRLVGAGRWRGLPPWRWFCITCCCRVLLLSLLLWLSSCCFGCCSSSSGGLHAARSAFGPASSSVTFFGGLFRLVLFCAHGPKSSQARGSTAEASWASPAWPSGACRVFGVEPCLPPGCAPRWRDRFPIR